ncbi:transcriptional regulator, LacI family [Williamsia sterculiae]|uniref:Transcriptional regulator, LacI family n=1 Tax=Williamsia sterculiae TaxID=1344003 RepID=A0A1N7HFW6_9NOCA|nr:transcriptional regulator, LacI family [Williamsia sterculiae]
MGTKRPTVADVARRAGTSTAVVSYVLNDGPRPVSDPLRARVSRAIDELDYRPDRRAQALRRQRRWRQIGLLVPDLTLPLFGEFVGSVERHARMRDYLTLVGNTGYEPEREEEFVTAFTEGGIDGLVVVGACNATTTAAQCAQARVPVVWMHNVRGDIDSEIVGIDHVEAGELATRHLVETHDCRDLAFVGGFTADDVAHGDRETVEQRYHGAMQVDGAAITQVSTDLTAGGAYAAVRDLLQRRPTLPAGVVVATYGQAAATTRALVDHGLRIPEDIKVVGFDGSQDRYGQFDVTSAQQPVDAITDLALDNLNAPAASATGPVPAAPVPFLHVGSSCGCRG